jgi:hypothetical protein
MNIEEYCDTLNIEIALTYYPNQNKRWCANFKSAGVKDSASSAMIRAEFVNGHTPEQAITAYVDKIKGRLLVIDAMSDTRREYKVPNSLSR